jgi:hypothetical protein
VTEDGERANAATDAEALEATPTDLTLADVLAGAAEELGIEGDGDAATTTWSAGSGPFAVLAGGEAEFRLDPVVARAALRTPGTSVSMRGAEWVAFAPTIIDDGAVDRAEAWFLAAHRRATKGSAGG